VKCTTTDRLLQDFVEGRLDPETATALSEHLQVCNQCAQKAREWRQLRALLTQAPGPAPSEEFIRQTVLAVHKARRSPAARSRRVASKDNANRWSFLYSEKARNVAASFAAAIVLMLVGNLLVSAAGSPPTANTPDLSAVSGTASDVVSSVFIKLGGALDGAFGWLMCLVDTVRLQ